ncbi:MAG: V-type proton ATPase subunit E [Verrucomicrobia bacterium]|nr:V-type proton ATPase subunit E [Verrucomicrobiota bacterium]
MTSSNAQSPELLREEILAQGRREREEILRQAAQQAAALLSKVKIEADQWRQHELEHARAEAARRSELTRAAVNVEAHLLRLARVESLLQAVRDEAWRRLVERQDFDYRQCLRTLAREAVERMEGTAFVVRLNPSDRAALGQNLIEDLAQSAGGGSLEVTVEEDPALGGGGVMVLDPAGRQLWDNRLEARLDRLWPELRRQVAVQAGLVPSNPPKGVGA